MGDQVLRYLGKQIRTSPRYRRRRRIPSEPRCHLREPRGLPISRRTAIPRPPSLAERVDRPGRMVAKRDGQSNTE